MLNGLCPLVGTDPDRVFALKFGYWLYSKGKDNRLN
jgi:hypothetical protein